MYWDTDTVPSTYIEDLLNSSNVTLERLLEEENILQECKGQNTKVIDFLTKPDVLERLVAHVVSEPVADGDIEHQYRYASVAAEIFACNIPAIVNQLSSQHQLLERLYQLLLQKPPLNPLLASFFARTISLLIVRRSEQSWYSYQVNCPQVLEFLRGRGDFIDLLLRHIGTSAIMDLLCALTSNIEVPECRLATLQWLNEQRLVQRLATVISDSQSADRQSNAAEALITMINQARQRENQMVVGETEDNPLIDAIETREFVDLLLDSMLSGFDDRCTSTPPSSSTAHADKPAIPLAPSHETDISSAPDKTCSESAVVGVTSLSTDCEMSAEVNDITMETAGCVGDHQLVDESTSSAERTVKSCDVASSVDSVGGGAVATDSGGGAGVEPASDMVAAAGTPVVASDPPAEVADSHLTSESAGRGSALVHGVPLLLCLLDTQHAHPLLSGATSSTTPASGVSSSPADSADGRLVGSTGSADGSDGGGGVGGSEWSSVQLTCSSIVTRLACLHRLLVDPPILRPPMVMSCGQLQLPPLGVERLHVAQLVTALVAAGRAEVNAELCRLDMLNTLLDLFFKYSLNNFLHAHVERCISYVLLTECKRQQADSESDRTHNQLLQYLMSNCRLLERILDGLSDENVCPDNTPSRRCFLSLAAYRGHLVAMANCVQDSARRGGNSRQLQRLLLATPTTCSSDEQEQHPVAPSVITAWNKFCDTQLQQINNRNKVYDLKMNEQRSSDSVGFISQNQSGDMLSSEGCRMLTSSLWKEPELGKSSAVTNQLLPTADSNSWEVDELISPGYSFLSQSDQLSADNSAELQFERQCDERISSLIEDARASADADGDVDASHSSDEDDEDRDGDAVMETASSSSARVANDVWSFRNADADGNDDDDERQSIEFDDEAPWPATGSPMDAESMGKQEADDVWGDGGAGSHVTGDTEDAADGWADFDAFAAVSTVSGAEEKGGSDSGDCAVVASENTSVDVMKSESAGVYQCQPCSSDVSVSDEKHSLTGASEVQDNCKLVTSSNLINGEISEENLSACTNSTS